MTSSAAKKHFDVLEFVKTSKALGVTEELAEYQARQFEQVVDIASANTQEEFHVRELSTKTDIVQLGAEIKQLEIATKSDILQVESALKADIAGLAAVTKTDIAELAAATKSDILQLGAEIKQLELATKSDVAQIHSEIKQLGLATKVDLAQTTSQLSATIERYRYDTLKFVVWTSVSIVVFLGSLLAKGFHWFG